jgi:protein-tyrosine-phosphatase
MPGSRSRTISAVVPDPPNCYRDEVIVHFICRGNAFRSIIAEAYLNSLKFENLKAMSSGTVAAAERAGNQAAFTETLELLTRNGIREYVKTSYGDQLTQARLAGADVVICMNQIVYDECQQFVILPAGTRIWSVADIGEPGRFAHAEPGKNLYREGAYQEIVEAVSQLISEPFVEDITRVHPA